MKVFSLQTRIGACRGAFVPGKASQGPAQFQYFIHSLGIQALIINLPLYAWNTLDVKDTVLKKH